MLQLPVKGAPSYYVRTTLKYNMVLFFQQILLPLTCWIHGTVFRIYSFLLLFEKRGVICTLKGVLT